MRRLAFFFFLIAASSTVGFAGAKPAGAAQIVKKWRDAVHAGKSDAPETAALTSTSDEDGIPGNVQEWLTTTGDYRRVVRREFDDTEAVLTPHSTLRRDRNGFLRPVQGEELSRLRTAAFDDKPASEFTLGQLRVWLTVEGEHHEVKVSRGSETLTIPVGVKLVSL